MSRDTPKNIPASVRARLKNKADALGITLEQALRYYAMERFLFRLSQTPWADALVVKGAAMLRVWDGAVARPTQDIDFLGRIDNSPESVERIVRECLDVTVDDGLEFSPDVVVEPITVADRYPGARATLRGKLSGARITLQLDIGVSDVAVPEPGWVDYPTLLGTDSPRILAYQPATAVAEKFETMIAKGLSNSRVKDYYDIWMLSRALRFRGVELRDAIQATFSQRGTSMPRARPPVLAGEFANQPAARAQWVAFSKKLRASGLDVPDDLSTIVERVSTFVVPVAVAVAAGAAFELMWEPDSGWSDQSTNEPREE
ncbi:MAG: nucleotidyl transferase AbiEii/AbiGii toxin family protein [Coriobacteriia bacterium]